MKHFVHMHVFLRKVLGTFLKSLGGLLFPKDQEPLALSVRMKEKSSFFGSQLSLKFTPQLCIELGTVLAWEHRPEQDATVPTLRKLHPWDLQIRDMHGAPVGEWYNRVKEEAAYREWGAILEGLENPL